MARVLTIVNEMAHLAVQDAFQPYALEFRESPAGALQGWRAWLATFRGTEASGQILFAMQADLFASLGATGQQTPDLGRELTNVIAGAIEAEFLRRGLAVRYTMPQEVSQPSFEQFDCGTEGSVCFLESTGGCAALGIGLTLTPGTVLEPSPTRRLPRGFGPIDANARTPYTRGVLVVDDSAAARESVVGTLAGAGFEVLEADSGESALALLRRRQDVRMVFTDLHMEGMQGAEFIRRLKAEEGLSSVAVVVITASPSALAAVDKSQIVTCLFKPISPAAVISLTHRVLARAS